MSAESIFSPGRQCWRIEKADYASVIVDYANYYRDLHQSICKARHSVFILGWDIDGRIELIRGEDKEKSIAPSCLFELIKWKLAQNPDIKIYLNKWDYSIFFAKEREPFANSHWKTIQSDNFHYCLDGILPIGACHHQKIAIIDDEVAYCGGMDIAPARWDFREHHPVNPSRQDPEGIFNPHNEAFAPYHDIMMVTSGPAAQALAELVRERWKLACRGDMIPLIKPSTNGLPHTWPDSDGPDFENVDIAIARTSPPLRQQPRREEIIAAYLAEIPQAETFIYIENQFLVQKDIALALNRQLRAKPELRVLAVSCDHPKGVMEKKSMWAPRLTFREIVESGGVKDRVALVYPISREDGHEDPVRIHSKLMIIDDKYLHIGSANINNRSMGVDTECDQILIGKDEKSREKIVAIRTDLIREHSGREAADIERLIKDHARIEKFLEEVPTSRQHFRRINDEPYRKEKFIKLAQLAADPRRPLITANLTIPATNKRFAKYLSKPWIWIALSIAILAMVCVTSFAMRDTDALSSVHVTQGFKDISHSPFAIPVVLGLFVIGGLVLFPITLLIAATSAAFGPVGGFFLSIAGTLLSASAGYFIGRKIGFPKLVDVFGKKLEAVKSKLNHSGVMGVALIRMLPISPFGLMNILFGINETPFFVYLTGSFLGILPGTFALALMGSSLFQMMQDPDPKNKFLLMVGFAAWIAMLVASNILSKKFSRKH